MSTNGRWDLTRRLRD